jgi:alpha-L-fucosidase 2
LLRKTTRLNLFDVCGLKERSPFQIDGNLGGPAGIAEMLIQSHGGVLRFLPALPKAWPTGSFRGLRARGGVEVDCAWHSGKATTATLRAGLNRRIQLAAPVGQKILRITQNGRNLPIQLTHRHEVNVDLKRGMEYVVAFA